MPPSDELQTDETVDDAARDVALDESDGADKEPKKLDLTVKIESRSACQRHITVTIPRADIDRYFDEAYSELMDKANVPGFRAGRAPRKLVEARFRKDVSDQVKGSLLMDSMGQVTEEHELAAISEPDIDPVAIEVPEDGPMTFEFDLEVRPEFDLPQWKGLTIERPVGDFSDADVDKQLQALLAKYGRLAPHDGPAESGDYVSCKLAFKDGDTELSSSDEEVIRIRPVLSFRDGKIKGFDKLMQGVTAGETRETTLKLSNDAPNQALRGKKISAVFEVHEVKKLELPKLTPAFLEQMGGFESEADLRDVILESLQRQLGYRQQQHARQQILAALTESADWQLPPDLLNRQAQRELQRSVLELRRNGFSDEQIRAHENELRQNSQQSTARALKEHFILERIAEEEEIEDPAGDYDAEIALIAAQSGESPRRVRAQLEKRNMMDVLRNQIIERKVIELILKHARFKDVPFKPEASDAEAVDQSAGGGETEDDIPQAKYAGDAQPLREPEERD
jgi:trigger factor